ncbi:hypothetical protein QTO34_011880 [Cnephaeus nilssonii]|uniref:Ig-like domain-containing protein n=1 Tax=Cnephaeus nilssonii TaxID=3371016 RepID=A0AA40LDN8_CNENI|nr:hypothetical protein QTO34_011880 [Eptesicus nilssonii]
MVMNQLHREVTFILGTTGGAVGPGLGPSEVRAATAPGVLPPILPPSSVLGAPAPWGALGIALCFLSAGLCAPPVLTQPPSASASPGASAKLTCTLSSEHSSFSIYWYQQRAGQAPRYIMRLYSNGTHTKGTGSRSLLRLQLRGDRYLTISPLQSEDEAEYICGVAYNTGGIYQGFHNDSDKGEVGLKPPSLCLLLPGDSGTCSLSLSRC